MDIAGRPCRLEHAISADVALVAAAEADGHRNLAYVRFYEHLNHYAALGARRCVAQAARQVQVLPAERIRTPGLVVTEVVVPSPAGALQ
jgi:3-oxoacid CoA-transferase subunit A